MQKPKPINPHVAAKERKEVQYPVFSLTGEEKYREKKAGEVETLGIRT